MQAKQREILVVIVVAKATIIDNAGMETAGAIFGVKGGTPRSNSSGVEE